MADNTLTISPFMKFEIKSPARGLTDYDSGAITPDQQEKLNLYKWHLMRENVLHMAKKFEYRGILYWIAEYVWLAKPKEIIPRVARKLAITEDKLREIARDRVLQFREDLTESEDEEWDY